MALAGAVVSKPMAKNTTCCVRVRARERHARRAASRRRARRRRGAQRAADRRASRARAACRRTSVKMTSGRAAMACARSIISSDVTHTGQPGPCTSSTLGRQHAVDAVADDRVRLAAAHLHEHPRPRDRAGDRARPAPARRRASRYSSRYFMARLASRPRRSARRVCPSSSSSALGARGLLAIDARRSRSRRGRARSRRRRASGWYSRQTSRVMPPKRTLRERAGRRRSRTSTTSPGMPRHMAAPSCRRAGRRRPRPGRARAPPSFGRHAAVDEHLEAVGLEQRLRALGRGRRFWKQPPESATVGDAASARARRHAGGDRARQRRVEARGERAARPRRAAASAASARTVGRRSIDERRRPRVASANG